MERKLIKRRNRTFFTHIVTFSTRKCRPPDGTHFAQSRHVDNNGNYPSWNAPWRHRKNVCHEEEFLKVTKTLKSTPESLLISQIGARRPPSTPSVYERTCFDNAHFATFCKIGVCIPSGDGAKYRRHANTKWANPPRNICPYWRLRGTRSTVGVPNAGPRFDHLLAPHGPHQRGVGAAGFEAGSDPRGAHCLNSVNDALHSSTCVVAANAARPHGWCCENRKSCA